MTLGEIGRDKAHDESDGTHSITLQAEEDPDPKDEYYANSDFCLPDPDEVEQYEHKLFKIDPVSKDFVWKELWKPRLNLCRHNCRSISLQWNPIEGHR